MFIYEEKYTGKSAGKKLGELFQYMDQNHMTKLEIKNREEIAWLLNLREENYEPLKENDASIYSPVFESKLIIDKKDNDTLLAQTPEAFDIVLSLNEAVDNQIRDYLDELRVKVEVVSGKLSDDNEQTVISAFKMIKNEVEIENMKKAHLLDGAKMSEFIYYLKHNDMSKLSELDVMDRLESLRKEVPSYFMPSFETIAGYNEHGAIIHYEATSQSNVMLDNKGVIVIDAGGQYLEGTTDTTRTIALGDVTDFMKQMYTAVLKGHIAVALSVFDQGTKGSELDVKARACLKDLGYDYAHGTGHGVGCLLNVHEHPRRVFGADTVLAQGMITSNEPGVYIEGEFGIRIENVVVVDKCEDKLCFENLTVCPYDYELIDESMLSDAEKQYLNNYHKALLDKLEGRVDDKVYEWLKSFKKF